MLFRVHSGNQKAGAVAVYLNVYDLTSINAYAYWLGLGVHHSGVEVHGVEYAYGAHERATSGIFEGQPRHCAGFAFRRSILMGRTDLGPREVRALIEPLAVEYTGNTYNLVSKNCNHFCNDLCLRLAGRPIPRWVNRLASIGFLCRCVLPLRALADGIREDETKGKREEERRKLMSNSTRIPSPTYAPVAYSPTTKSHGGKRRYTSTSSIVDLFPDMTV